MFPLLFWLGVFAVSLFLVIKSSDWFIDGAEKLARHFGLSEWLIGLTLVAIGTSLPELVTGFTAAFEGYADLVVDNVVGSNIANILLVIGLAAIAARVLDVKRDLIDLDLPLLFASQVILVFFLLDGHVNFVEAVISFGVLCLYLVYTFALRKDERPKRVRTDLFRTSLLILGSVALLILSAKYTVDSLVRVGAILGVGANVLSITALAIGTSLPELMVSISAAKKGSFKIAFGNIIGSNIFNSAGVIGLVGMFFPMFASIEIMSVGLFFLGAATLMCVFSGISKRIHSWEGALMVVIYFIFIGKLFALF